MTELSQTQRKNPSFTIAGVAFAALLLGGIVGNRVEAVVQGAAADAARAAAVEEAKWDAYGAAWQRRYSQQNGFETSHDRAVLLAAQEWEARYRQMYPATR